MSYKVNEALHKNTPANLTQLPRVSIDPASFHYIVYSAAL